MKTVILSVVSHSQGILPLTVEEQEKLRMFKTRGLGEYWKGRDVGGGCLMKKFISCHLFLLLLGRIIEKNLNGTSSTRVRNKYIIQLF